MQVYIVGFGDIGYRIANLHLFLDHKITALVRSLSRVSAAEALGIGTFRADLDEPASLAPQPIENRIVYYLAPPPAVGKRDTRLWNWLGSIGTDLPAKVIYISTTGVYGDCKGAWVDERRPPNPMTDRARRRLDAENQLVTWGEKYGISVVRLRVPGIYHPSRLPVKALQEGRPILKPKEAPFTSRIHADDLARICLAAAERGKAGEIYNVADNDATTMSDYFIQVAEALGLPTPPEISWPEAEQQLSSTMLSYLKESRRIDNTKMIEELGVKLLYPTLAEGLAGL